MTLAFHILAHKNPIQLGRLLDAIWAPENIYVVHYDRRRPGAEHRAVRALAAQRTNILIQSPRAVLWGRFSQLKAQLDGLQIALARGGSWTHWINLSGQCFPLQTPARLSEILSAEAGMSSVNGYDPLTTPYWPNAQRRLDQIALDSPCLEWLLTRRGLGRRLRRFFGGGPIPVKHRTKPKPPAPFARWFGGDNWVVLSRAAAEFALSPKAAPIVGWLADTLQPEESFFQTLLMNDAEALPRHGDHRREILWFENDISPSVFRMEHFERLEQAAQNGRLFARKFDFAVDAAIVDAIEQRLLRKSTTS